MTTASLLPAPKAPPTQTVPQPSPPRGAATAPFARVADGFKTDTWQVGLGAGWRS